MTSNDPQSEIRRPQPKRILTFEGVTRIDGAAMKTYTIRRCDHAIDDRDRRDTIETSTAIVARALASTPSAQAHHGAGFVCIHFGEHAVWLLVNWWAQECMLCQRLYRADLGTTEFTEMTTGLVGCTWELAVHCHERAAWTRHVLYDDQPHWLDRYLDDVTSGEI